MKKFGKILPVFGGVTFAVWLAACGDDSNNAVSGKKSDDVASYATVDDLPNCTANRDGVVGFVEEDDASYVCLEAKWKNVGEIYSSEEDFPNCTKNRENSKVYAQNTREAFVCNNGRWSHYGVGNSIEQGESTSSSSANSGTNKTEEDKSVSSSSSKKDESKSSSSATVRSSSSVANQASSSVKSSSSNYTIGLYSSGYVIPTVRSSSSSLVWTYRMSSSGYDCGDMWCGLTDSLGKVEVVSGFKDSSGKLSTEKFISDWYKYDDREIESGFEGSSSFVFPDGLGPDEHDGSFGPLIKAKGGIEAMIKLGADYEGESYYPAYEGFGFDLLDFSMDGGADVSAWGGICIVYKSDLRFSIVLHENDEASVTEYNNFTAFVDKSSTMVYLDIPWERFKQDSRWGIRVEQSKVLSQLRSIRIKFSGDCSGKEASGNFVLQSIGRRGTCYVPKIGW